MFSFFQIDIQMRTLLEIKVNDRENQGSYLFSVYINRTHRTVLTGRCIAVIIVYHAELIIAGLQYIHLNGQIRLSVKEIYYITASTVTLCRIFKIFGIVSSVFCFVHQFAVLRRYHDWLRHFRGNTILICRYQAVCSIFASVRLITSTADRNVFASRPEFVRIIRIFIPSQSSVTFFCQNRHIRTYCKTVFL